MALDKAAVAHIAALARIRLDDSELEPLAAELSHILGWVEQLAEVDTSDVAPMSSVAAMRSSATRRGQKRASLPCQRSSSDGTHCAHVGRSPGRSQGTGIFRERADPGLYRRDGGRTPA